MRALLITGPVGVGKTTVAEAVGDVLAAAEVPHAVIDLDWLRCFRPSPADEMKTPSATSDIRFTPWFRSSYSQPSESACVEITFGAGEGGVRDSKAPD
ncbi:DUF397 domain-containing protein [Lentzea nigeriaca]|uniref:DUF397 domain-containing protein n=1 Tax=Lentzea nigeriaca TaxID=1128665 RepID=UPI00195B3B8B|nr:DUF397 domain-containing protein [Lentzea nigeriaca]MBM7860062.1 hypothetical protein [Lentzea nigeriaca]